MSLNAPTTAEVWDNNVINNNAQIISTETPRIYYNGAKANND